MELEEYKTAAAVLAGYEPYTWVLVDWAGPRLVPNTEARPPWLKKLLEEEEDDHDKDDKEAPGADESA